MKTWKPFRLWSFFLFFAFMGACLRPCIGMSTEDRSKEKYKFVKFDPISESEVLAYKKEILEKWPKNQWKTFYVCNWAEREIFSFQAPKEAKWEQCNVTENNKIQKSAKGNECCYVDDFTPNISLTFSKGDFSRKMSLKTDLYDRQMQIKMDGSKKKYEESVKNKTKQGEEEFRAKYIYDGLKDFERLSVGGIPVFYISIENWGYNSLQFSYLSLNFDFEDIGGQVNASEFDKKSKFYDFLPLDQMVFTDLIKEIFKTAKILVPVKDWPEKRLDNSAPSLPKKNPVTK